MASRIGEILIQKKWVSPQELETALEEQRNTKELVGEILVRKKILSQQLLYKALAEQQRIRFVDLKRIKINPKAVELIPREVAEKYALMPIEISGHSLTVGISNPLNTWPDAELKSLTKMKEIRTVLCLPDAVQQALQEHYKSSKVSAVPQ